MSLVRLIPAWLHAIADYAVALTLIVVALVVGGPGKAVATGVVVGAVVLVVSMLTRYPLGVIKVLPFKIHSAGDYLAAALLIAAPFVLSFTDEARGLSIVYFAAGGAVLLVSLVTNYQYGPQREKLTSHAGDWSARPDRRAASGGRDSVAAARFAVAAAYGASTTNGGRAVSTPAQATPAPGRGVAAPSEPRASSTGSRPLREILAEQRAAKD